MVATRQQVNDYKTQKNDHQSSKQICLQLSKMNTLHTVLLVTLVKRLKA